MTLDSRESLRIASVLAAVSGVAPAAAGCAPVDRGVPGHRRGVDVVAAAAVTKPDHRAMGSGHGPGDGAADGPLWRPGRPDDRPLATVRGPGSARGDHRNGRLAAARGHHARAVITPQPGVQAPALSTG